MVRAQTGLGKRKSEPTLTIDVAPRIFFLPLIAACTSWLTTGHDAVYVDPCLKAAAVLGSVFVTIFLVWLLHWHVLALSLLAGRMGRY